MERHMTLMSIFQQGLAAGVAREISEIASADAEVWVVTHSLGGVVLRHIMALPYQGGMRWAGVCMIAPPNRGSTVARKLRNAGFPLGSLFRAIAGKAGVQQRVNGNCCHTYNSLLDHGALSILTHSMKAAAVFLTVKAHHSCNSNVCEGLGR